MSSSSPNVVFSFCIYGNQQKYCRGLVENLKLIQKFYPTYGVRIYYHHDVPEEYLETYRQFPNVELREMSTPNMVERFFVLEDDENVDVVIIRDADSRIHMRDRYCIDHFISSKFLCHTIRDHHLHHSPIMGGLWGIKRGFLGDATLRQLYTSYISSSHSFPQSSSQYGHDMFFLRFCVYPRVLSSFVVYTFAEYLRLHVNEYLILMTADIPDGNFCGQVIDYDVTGQEVQQYKFPV